MEVGVLEVWNDIDTESESEVSNEECEDDLMQKYIGSSSGEENITQQSSVAGLSSPQELLACSKRTLLCMSGRKLVVTVR